MSRSLTRLQAAVLGLVCLFVFGLAGWALFNLGHDWNPWQKTAEVSARFDAAHGVSRGTPVRMYGMKAGWVDAVEPPTRGDPDPKVTFRIRLQLEYADNLRADASADIVSDGLLGNKAIDLSPGKEGDFPPGGILKTSAGSGGGSDSEIRSAARSIEETAKSLKAEHTRLATKTDETLAKIGLAADSLRTNHDKITGQASEALKTVNKVAGALEGTVEQTKTAVADGHALITVAKQDVDAIKKLPIVSMYVEPAPDELLIRPNLDRTRYVYEEAELFEPGQCILTDDGKRHMDSVARVLNDKPNRVKGSEVVVAVFADPKKPGTNPATGKATSRLQAEAITAYLRDRHKTHALGSMPWSSSRKIVPVGLGFAPPPTPEKDEKPPARVEVILFKPL